MSGDEFRHLEHTDLALAVEYRPERIVRVDHGSLFFVLTTVLLDVVPELFGELGTRQRLRADNCGQLVVGLHWSHEGGVRLVLVELDFPRAKVLAPEIAQQNQILAQHFGIQVFPSIIILDGDGKKIGELQGYDPRAGRDGFIATLERLRKG